MSQQSPCGTERLEDSWRVVSLQYRLEPQNANLNNGKRFLSNRIDRIPDIVKLTININHHK